MVFMTQILSQWNNYFPFSSMSSEEFYKLVEGIVGEHEYPGLTVSRKNHKEGGFFSSERQYLRVQRGDLVFDICAAPFGKDFYVSWWLFETEDAIRRFFKGSMVANFLAQRASNRTFYQADVEAIFRESIHSCVLQAIEHITNETGRKLSEHEKQIHVGEY